MININNKFHSNTTNRTIINLMHARVLLQTAGLLQICNKLTIANIHQLLFGVFCFTQQERFTIA